MPNIIEIASDPRLDAKRGRPWKRIDIDPSRPIHNAAGLALSVRVIPRRMELITDDITL